MLMGRNRRIGLRARTSSPRARLAPSTPAVLQVSPHILRGDGQAREHGHMDEIEAAIDEATFEDILSKLVVKISSGVRHAVQHDTVCCVP